MKVRELIAKLQEISQEKEIFIFVPANIMTAHYEDDYMIDIASIRENGWGLEIVTKSPDAFADGEVNFD